MNPKQRLKFNKKRVVSILNQSRKALLDYYLNPNTIAKLLE